MVRLHLVVEGDTEAAFVNTVLAPHLLTISTDAFATMVQTGRKGNVTFKGGALNYERFHRHLYRSMLKDPTCHFSMMVDLYRLDSGFPGYAESKRITCPLQRAEALESALVNAIGNSRFTPYFQVHEFESLLLTDPEQFHSLFVDQQRSVQSLHTALSNAQSPEHINDGPETAPSKRILNLFPGFKKATDGPIVAAAVGIERMRSRCAHFASWLQRLEKLGESELTR